MSDSNRRIKLVAIVSGLLVAGFLATSLASFFASRASLRAEILLNELPMTSDTIYSEIQHDLFRPIFIGSLMATDTFLRDWVISGEIGQENISRYLKAIQEKYRTVTSFFVSERTRTYYHADGILKQVSPTNARDNWYFRVREMQNEYEINVDPDMANKDTMTIFINYRVYDYDGNYIGATGVGLTVSAVSDLIEVYQKKYNRRIYFFDKHRRIVLAGRGFDSGPGALNTIDRLPRSKDGLDEKTHESFTYRSHGQLIHANIRFIEELEWYLVVDQTELETVQPILNTLLINLCVCVAITGVVLMLINYSVNAYQKRIETLRGIVPICSFCKQIRDDKGYWNKVEAYVAKHTDAQFSHSICPACMQTHYPEEAAAIEKKKRTR